MQYIYIYIIYSFEVTYITKIQVSLKWKRDVNLFNKKDAVDTGMYSVYLNNT